VRFAGERTLLAWLRTGLSLMGFGFVVARFGLFLEELAQAGHRQAARHPVVSLGIGTALVLLGVGVTVAAAWEHSRFLARLERGLPFLTPRWPLGLIMAGILAILGVGIAGSLVFLSRE
jgi:putative membrane protein